MTCKAERNKSTGITIVTHACRRDVINRAMKAKEFSSNGNAPISPCALNTNLINDLTDIHTLYETKKRERSTRYMNYYCNGSQFACSEIMPNLIHGNNSSRDAFTVFLDEIKHFVNIP